MSTWLKKRVVMWCALTIVLSGGWWFSSVQAQGEIAPPAKTPELAAQRFLSLLNLFSEEGRMLDGYRGGDVLKHSNPISRIQLEKNAGFRGSRDNDATMLLWSMAKVTQRPRYEGKIVEQSTDKATVELEKSASNSLPSVICTAEDGGWRVDLFATYAKWLNVSDFDRDMMIAEYTGDVSPALAADPAYALTRENKRRSNCQSNLKQIGLGIMQYTQDYDEELPPAREWAEVLQPYVKSRQLFHCPNVPNPDGYGYAFNSRLSRKSLASLKNVDGNHMVMIYETTDLGWNAYGLGENPAFRHLDGINSLTLYGDVRWHKKEQPLQFTFLSKK